MCSLWGTNCNLVLLISDFSRFDKVSRISKIDIVLFIDEFIFVATIYTKDVVIIICVKLELCTFNIDITSRISTIIANIVFIVNVSFVVINFRIFNIFTFLANCAT